MFRMARRKPRSRSADVVNCRSPCPSLRLMAFALALSGCYVPTPANHAVLHIAADGQFTFNGASIAPSDLAPTIRAAEHPGSALLLEISASPSASASVVQSAAHEAVRSHARVAFVQDKRER
jgi:hypothetical protein